MVSIGATSGGFSFARFKAIGSGSTLTLGNALTMNQAGRTELIANAGATIVNQGVINVGTAGRLFGLYGSIVNQGAINVTGGATLTDNSFGSFANQGTIALSGGGLLHLGGSFRPEQPRPGDQHRRHGVHRRHAEQRRRRAADRGGDAGHGGADQHGADLGGDDHRVGGGVSGRRADGGAQARHARAHAIGTRGDADGRGQPERFRITRWPGRAVRGRGACW